MTVGLGNFKYDPWMSSFVVKIAVMTLNSDLCPQVEVEIMDDGPENPYGNGWTVKNTPLSTEATAQRLCNAQMGRYWKISNPSVLHAVTGARCSTLTNLKFHRNVDSPVARVGMDRCHLSQGAPCLLGQFVNRKLYGTILVTIIRICCEHLTKKSESFELTRPKINPRMPSTGVLTLSESTVEILLCTNNIGTNT